MYKKYMCVYIYIYKYDHLIAGDSIIQSMYKRSVNYCVVLVK